MALQLNLRGILRCHLDLAWITGASCSSWRMPPYSRRGCPWTAGWHLQGLVDLEMWADGAAAESAGLPPPRLRQLPRAAAAPALWRSSESPRRLARCFEEADAQRLAI
eukprot:9468531-Pyramimonas_sp.AAC.1